jgi:transcriptional regulator with XRE-family HTH domain
MNAGMELVHPLEPSGDESPLAKARLQRQLTVEETARRAGLSAEEVRWLEEGRVYRFPSADDALLAALLYATALGVDAAEARRLAGLPPLQSFVRRHPRARYLVLGAAVVATGIALAVVFIPHGGTSGKTAGAGQAANLPPPWRIPVTVLNGSGNMVYTRRVADRVLSLAYRVRKVGRADNFNYPATAVFFPPRCEGVAARLADQLGVDAKPLPGGTGPCQLYVIVGPPRGPDN